MEIVANINGEIMDIDEAKINIEDRGFQLGDGIYEVVVSYQGKLFELDSHIKRLERSACLINLELDFTFTEIKEMCLETFAASGKEDAQLYIQVTRGISPRQHSFPSSYSNTLVMTVRDLPVIPDVAEVITVEDIRWKMCNVKSIDLLPNVLAKEKAHEAGCIESLFIRDGNVMEGASNNVFIVKDGTIVTPPANDLILEGITRNVVIDLIENLDLKLKIRDIFVNELWDADEVFLTGSHVGVLPVVKVDNRPIADGKTGEISARIMNEFEKLVSSL